jgi:hypothetical protein
MTDPMPNMEYATAACSKCGAKTFTEAENLCEPEQGYDDDYHCPTDGCEDREDGQIWLPTQGSLDRLEAWYERENARLEAMGHNSAPLA